MIAKAAVNPESQKRISPSHRLSSRAAIRNLGGYSLSGFANNLCSPFGFRVGRVVHEQLALTEDHRQFVVEAVRDWTLAR